jgi:hypothetical protein
MSVKVSIVNYLHSTGIKHRTFRSFHEEGEAECSNLLYHMEVRRMSQGRVLQRFVLQKRK